MKYTTKEKIEILSRKSSNNRNFCDFYTALRMLSPLNILNNYNNPNFIDGLVISGDEIDNLFTSYPKLLANRLTSKIYGNVAHGNSPHCYFHLNYSLENIKNDIADENFLDPNSDSYKALLIKFEEIDDKRKKLGILTQEIYQKLKKGGFDSILKSALLHFVVGYFAISYQYSKERNEIIFYLYDPTYIKTGTLYGIGNVNYISYNDKRFLNCCIQEKDGTWTTHWCNEESEDNIQSDIKLNLKFPTIIYSRFSVIPNTTYSAGAGIQAISTIREYKKKYIKKDIVEEFIANPPQILESADKIRSDSRKQREVVGRAISGEILDIGIGNSIKPFITGANPEIYVSQLQKFEQDLDYYFLEEATSILNGKNERMNALEVSSRVNQQTDILGDLVNNVSSSICVLYKSIAETLYNEQKSKKEPVNTILSEDAMAGYEILLNDNSVDVIPDNSLIKADGNRKLEQLSKMTASAYTILGIDKTDLLDIFKAFQIIQESSMSTESATEGLANTLKRMSAQFVNETNQSNIQTELEQIQLEDAKATAKGKENLNAKDEQDAIANRSDQIQNNEGNQNKVESQSENNDLFVG